MNDKVRGLWASLALSRCISLALYNNLKGGADVLRVPSSNRDQETWAYLLIRHNEGMCGVVPDGGVSQAVHGRVSGCGVGWASPREAGESIGESWTRISQSWGEFREMRFRGRASYCIMGQLLKGPF